MNPELRPFTYFASSDSEARTIDIAEEVQEMDYSKIIENLKQESLFDLYRLSIAINHQLENPQRVAEIKMRLKPGQIIRYFEPTQNRLLEAEVIKLNRTQILVRNSHDQQLWNIPVFWVNLDEVNTDIRVSPLKTIRITHQRQLEMPKHRGEETARLS